MVYTAKYFIFIFIGLFDIKSVPVGLDVESITFCFFLAPAESFIW